MLNYRKCRSLSHEVERKTIPIALIVALGKLNIERAQRRWPREEEITEFSHSQFSSQRDVARFKAIREYLRKNHDLLTVSIGYKRSIGRHRQSQ